MRLSSLASARPTYYDRNAIAVSGGYYGSVGPHGPTTRWTITNTASQKMYVDAGALAIIRDTAPTVSGMAFSALQSPLNTSVLLQFFQSVTVGATANMAMGGSILIVQGGSLVGVTNDGSTGGTILYGLFAHAIQFDA